MRRGPPFKPDLSRYRAAGHVPAVYLIEAGHGVVKVGRANSAGARLAALHAQLKRTGVELGRFHVFPVELYSLTEVECDCIQALARVATPLPSRREYFSGVTFDAAVELLQPIASA